jgi:anti-sigma B factor antagonist
MTSPDRRGDHVHGDHLHIERRIEGKAVVVRAAGEVDVTTSSLLRDQLKLAAALATPPAPVVADLRDVEFCGSEGVAVLVEAAQRCQQQHAELRLIAGSAVLRPLDVLGLQDVFTLWPTLDAALDTAD